jgi:replicative DNA helicase
MLGLNDLIDQFETRVWDPDASRGLATGSQILDQGLEGLQPGWHVMAADSNVGKSAFLTWLETNLIRKNKDSYVLSLSLDDPEQEKFARIAATWGRVPINCIRRPTNYSENAGMLQRRGAAIEAVRGVSDRYTVLGSNFQTPKGPASDIDAIEWIIQQALTNLEEEALQSGKRKKLVVIVDNFHDTTTASRKVRDEGKFEYFASRYADLAIKYNIALVSTAELRKINGYKRPMVDDIRDSAKIKYEAKSIWMCFNEVSLRGESANIYYELDGNPTRQPVYELQVAKNKYGSYKGRIFYLFHPHMAWFQEADPAAQKAFITRLNSGD